MQTLDVAAALDANLECPRCHADGHWVAMARPKTRENSVIHHLCCTRCGDRVVAKVGGGKHWCDNDRVELRHEYATLCAIHAVFPQEGGIGTLEPLGYMEAAGRGILVTRWFMGTDVVHYARGSDAPALERAFRLAGRWLFELHGADKEMRPPRSLGVAEKVEDLLRTYGGVLRTHPRAWNACELLTSTGSSLEVSMARAVRIHGDFKPQNMLYADTRCIGLDIHWRIISAAIYDLAPFLNHLWLAGVGGRGASAESRYLLAEKAFLTGYGGATPMRALRWAQLYFALCHLGGYRQRGGLAVVYATWKVWPLIRHLEGLLRELG